MVYGYAHPHVNPHEKGIARLETVEQGLLERDKVISILKSNLELLKIELEFKLTSI